MKIHDDIEQNSVDWHLIRAGKVTASRASALVTPLGKIKTGDAVETLLNQMLAETWIGGNLPVMGGSFDTEQGSIVENAARNAFAFQTDKEVKQVAFIESDCGRFGCSPDGVVVGENAGVEIKALRMENHVGYLREGIIPDSYIVQIQFSLFVTGWPLWYFVSYRSGFPTLILKAEPDARVQSAIKTALESFWTRHDAELSKLLKMNGGEPNPRTRGKIPFRKPQPINQSFDLVP